MMGDFEALPDDYKRGWRTCKTGGSLTLGLGEMCDSADFASGYLDCMKSRIELGS